MLIWGHTISSSWKVQLGGSCVSETHIFKSNIITFHLVSITWCSEFSDYQVLIWEAHFYFYIHKRCNQKAFVWDAHFLNMKLFHLVSQLPGVLNLVSHDLPQACLWDSATLPSADTNSYYSSNNVSHFVMYLWRVKGELANCFAIFLRHPYNNHLVGQGTLLFLFYWSTKINVEAPCIPN